MKKHSFRAAIENKVSIEEFAKIFSTDVVIYAPMLSKPVHGVDNTLLIVRNAVDVVAPIVYTLEVSDSHQTFLFWEGNVSGNLLQAVTILVDDEQGLIREMRVLMRSWPVVTLFRNAMFERLKDVIAADYWELDPSQTVDEGTRKFTPIALSKILLAPEFELHSPMLTHSIKGKEQVELALKMAHTIQTKSSYTSIIATPDLIVELFDCDAAGNPLEGIWVSKLNDQGEIYDLTVYLRPYPSVTVLRNNAKKLAETIPEFAFMGIDYWELNP